MSVWRGIRKPFIASAVLAHFTFGLLCFIDPPSPILRITALAIVLDWYQQHDFAQTWRMFAPPSQTLDEVGYALEFDSGWTNLLYLDQYLKDEGAKSFFLPRGYLRIANQLRHPIFKKAKLTDEPFYFFYYQQLGAFFCFGDGRLPGLKTIRFYSVVSGLPPFRDTDGKGHRLPQAEDFNKIEAVYQRSCSDR